MRREIVAGPQGETGETPCANANEPNVKNVSFCDGSVPGTERLQLREEEVVVRVLHYVAGAVGARTC